MRDFAISCVLSVLVASSALASCPIPFAPGSNLGAGGGSYNSVIEDFNHDGRRDVAIVNFSSHNVTVRLAVPAPQPIGTFLPTVNYPVGTSPRCITTGDFNRDGIPDLAVGNGSTLNASILIGNGDGTFRAAVNYLVGGAQPQAIVTRDMNGDNKLDLLVAMATGIGFLRGNGDGTFQTATVIPVPQSMGVATGDFNNDGIPDIVSTNYDAPALYVALGLGGGNFGPTITYATAFGPWGVAAGDVNGDGVDDVVCANYVSNSMSVFISNVDGTLRPRVNYNANGSHPDGIALVDLNNDGKPDVVTSNFSSNTISVFRNNGNGTYTASATTSAGSGPFGVAAGDINNDGTQDLVIADQTSGGATLLLNHFCAADFNCDGTSDFFDYLDFVDRFSRNDPTADFNADGIIDFFDYLDFVQQFQILCP